jgi:hypothetical protein
VNTWDDKYGFYALALDGGVTDPADLPDIEYPLTDFIDDCDEVADEEPGWWEDAPLPDINEMGV